mgnify:CR=1 FL=1
MRIALILLSILALIFIGSISWSLISQDGGIHLKKTSNINPSGDTLVIETWKNQIKTDEKIEKLSNLVSQLAEKNWVQNWEIWTSQTQTGKTNTVKISGVLLSLLMPTLSLTEKENTGIFDLHIFDSSIHYTSYEDVKNGVQILALNLPYENFLKNVKALDDTVYAVNETNTFPFRSFYVNPPKPDSLVRIVVEAEWKAIAIQVVKTKFPLLKDLLISKSQKIPNTPQKKNPQTIPVKPKANTGSTR